MAESQKINLGPISFMVGSGAPTMSASKGSVYINTAGTGVADRMYINTDGAATWTAVTTVA